jgi:N-acetylmuramoyl-L-alanine amidase
MSTGIKNGKHHTINIYSLKLILPLLLFTFVTISGSENISEDKKWVIVIDAGHGGNDSGAPGTFSFEKNITLAIALKTGEYIEKNLKNVSVMYTRKNNTFVELKERADFANRNNADLFLSIHTNGSTLKNVKGAETYIMGLAKDEQNLEVAMKENEVILLEKDYSTKYEGFDPKSPESYIMFTLMQNIYQQQSMNLASKIQTEYKESIKRIDRGVKQAGFVVLFMTTMPSILTETGFITNANEEKFLNSNEGQDYIASALFRACRAYINELDSKSGISTMKEKSKAQETKVLPSLVSADTEIVYMVQVAASASKTLIIAQNFNGLNDITEIAASGRYKYASGNFPEYPDAVKYRKKLVDIYPDAFVIAVKGNKILPLQEALEQKSKK